MFEPQNETNESAANAESENRSFNASDSDYKAGSVLRFTWAGFHHHTSKVRGVAQNTLQINMEPNKSTRLWRNLLLGDSLFGFHVKLQGSISLQAKLDFVYLLPPVLGPSQEAS